MNAALDAIYARWTATMGATPLYIVEADEGAAFPYAVASIVSDTPDGTFTEDYEDCLFQFNLFSTTSNTTQVGDIFESLKAAFDKHDLNIVGCTTISLKRVNSFLIKLEGVWQINVTYRLVFEI